jgi:hypothetical protein
VRALTAIVGVGALAATPALAQRTGSRIGRDLGAKDGAAAMQIIAECVAYRRPDLVARWFQTLPGSSDEYALLRHNEGDFSVCADNKELVMDGREVTFHAPSLRLPVARAAVQIALRNAPGQSPDAPDSDPWFMAELNALPATASVDKTYLAMLDFGHCVAVHDWPGSVAFLKSKASSAEEGAAVKQLVPVLGPCLTSDSKIAITPANLRDMLAEPVLHPARGWGSAAAPAGHPRPPSAGN